MDSFDVVVVGGGLIGSALAYELSGSGVRTAVVDRRDVGRATDAGAGILSPETITGVDRAWIELATAAGEHYAALIHQLREDGAPETGYAPCGVLRLAFRECDDELYNTSATSIFARGDGAIREVSPREASTMFPPLGPIRAGMFNARGARVDGRMLTAALVHEAQARGAEHRTASVVGFSTHGDRVTAVATDRGELGCDAVVVAGGAWTAALGRELDVHLPVVPVRGQIVHLVLDGVETAGWPILQPVLSHYVVPWPDGRVAVGATFEPEAAFDARPTAAGIRQLLTEMTHLAPGLGAATFVEVRVGLRPVSVDDTPILGRLPGVANAYVATGHGANGLLLGPYSARLVADVMIGHEPAIDLRAFSAARFGRADHEPKCSFRA